LHRVGPVGFISDELAQRPTGFFNVGSENRKLLAVLNERAVERIQKLSRCLTDQPTVQRRSLFR
jgi:hypothetical protein